MEKSIIYKCCIAFDSLTPMVCGIRDISVISKLYIFWQTVICGPLINELHWYKLPRHSYCEGTRNLLFSPLFRLEERLMRLVYDMYVSLWKYTVKVFDRNLLWDVLRFHCKLAIPWSHVKNRAGAIGISAVVAIRLVIFQTRFPKWYKTWRDQSVLNSV